MGNKYLAGIDIGTTGAKATIFELDGSPVAAAYNEYLCTFPKPGWVEQDADSIVTSGMEAAKKALDTAKINPHDIAAVSFSAQRCCSIFVDSEGKVLRPMISWQDARTTDQVDEIKTKISDDAFYDITNLPLNPLYILTKMLWVRQHEPEIWDRTHKVIQLQDYTLRRWGVDGYFNDMSDTNFYGLWDPYRMKWSETLLSVFGISRDLLPEPIESGQNVGAISKEAAELTGFAEGTPLCVGVGDQNAAAIGAGIDQPGLMSVSLGTGCLAAAYLDQPFRDPNKNTMVTNHAIRGSWQLEGIQLGAGSVYRWFRDEIATLEKAYADKAVLDPYTLFDEMIATVPPGANGLVMLPYLAGAATPKWEPEARGTILGLSFAHDRKCLARCFMEGITLEIRDMIKALFDSGLDINKIRILGGATKSSLWNQMQADVYNLPVETLEQSDAAILGAAISAGIGIGTFKNFSEGAEQMVKVKEVFEPRKEVAAIYDELYGIYTQAYDGLVKAGVFNRLATFQKNESATKET